MMGTLINTSHYVDPDQFEPSLPLDGQADQHVQEFVLLSMDAMVSYNVNERFQVGLELPLRVAIIEAEFVDKAGNSLPEFTSIHHRTETLMGIGDVALQGRYRLLVPNSAQRLRLDIVAGMSAPTGETQPNPFALGRMGKDHQHVFFGRGTFDPRLSIQAAYGLADVNLLFQTSWRGSVYENRLGYQGPQLLQVGFHGGSSLGLSAWQFGVGLEVVKEFPAKWAGELAENSGRLDIVPSIGATFLYGEGTAASLILKRPFTLSTAGGQIEVPFLVLLGGAYSFD